MFGAVSAAVGERDEVEGNRPMTAALSDWKFYRKGEARRAIPHRLVQPTAPYMEKQTVVTEP